MRDPKTILTRLVEALAGADDARLTGLVDDDDAFWDALADAQAYLAETQNHDLFEDDA